MSQTQSSDSSIDRRSALKLIGVATVSGASIPVFGGTVAAAGNSDAELELRGTIPSGTSIDATVEEYDTEGSSSPINDQTVTFDAAGQASAYPELDAQTSYQYLFDLTFNGGDDTPELESLLFTVPLSPNDYDTINYSSVLEWQAKPEHVTIEYDEYRLRQYQPMFVRSQQVRKDFKGLYGYVARSEEHDTDVMCYWAQLTHQDGLPGVRADSHLGDHEWIYVFVNSNTGAVEEIHYTAYHWFKGSIDFTEVTDPSSLLTSSWTDFPTHADFSIHDTYHHYRFTPSQSGGFVELKPWPEVRETWIQNGFYEPAHVPAIEDPWQIRDRDSLWADGSIDSYVASAWAQIDGVLGLFGGNSSDYYSGVPTSVEDEEA